jgi:outer membrane immunogenic protein
MRLEAMMRHVLPVTLIVGLAMAGAAQAADIPRGSPPPSYPTYEPVASSWQGLYVGAHGSYRFGSVARSAFDPDGFAGGLQIGYDLQLDRWVVGVVTDVGLSGATDSAAGNRFDERWYGTTRARVGYAVSNNLLPYVTGGLAYSGLSLRGGGDRESNVHLGWTLGIGAEMKLNRNWSLMAEYLYTDLASRTYDITGRAHDFDSSAIKVGVNYRF